MAKEQLLNLKFRGGDVTEIMDFEKTFGKLFYLGHETAYYFDEEKQELTDEVTGYDMVVVSEKTKKPYKVKLDVNVDLSSLNPRDEVTLVDYKVRFYQDSGALTQGATVSISAMNVEKVKEDSATKRLEEGASKKVEQGKPKES